MSKPPDPPDDSYRVRAASQLTGLSANTIRTWERRHHAVTPARSDAGGRRYSAADIERLVMLRQLTDAGQAIGELAVLSDRALKARLRVTAARSGSERLRIGVRSPALATVLRSSGSFAEVIQCDSDKDLNNFEGSAVLLQLAELGEPPAARVRELRRANMPVFVLYDFLSSGVREALAEAGAWLVRGPPDAHDLRRLIRLVVPRSGRRPASRAGGRRRFDDATLLRLMASSSPIQCECPKHLAELVRSLAAFEDYSQRCASRNAEDRALHQRLAEGTGRARAVMEDLLSALAEAEGLLPAQVPGGVRGAADR